MARENFERLIDLQDGILDEKEKAELLLLIQTDQSVKGEWQQIQQAVMVTREAGLKETVQAERNKFQSTNADHTTHQAPVRQMSTVFMKVAACVLLLIGSFTAIKYMTGTSQNMYGKYYVEYELNTSRGVGQPDPIELTYARKDWPGVMKAFTDASQHNTHSMFLYGMAQMELKQYAGAITEFKQILRVNDTAHEKLFEDEAQFYLAMSYLAIGDKTNAEPLLQTIRDDRGHVYHDRVK